jgi:hypothetical protein
MKITIGERLKGYVGKIFLGSLFLFSMGSFFLFYPLLADPDYYKNIILKEVNQQSGLSFDFKDSSPTFFPFPGISLKEVTVSKREKELIRVERVTIDVYYGIFLGRSLEIRSINLNTGSIEVRREKDESFPLLTKFFDKQTNANVNSVKNSINTEANKNKEISSIEVEQTFEDVFGSFPHRLFLKNITINFDDALYQRKITLYLWECSFKLDRFSRNFNISLYGKLNDETFELYADLIFLKNQLSFESLRFEGSLHLEEFSGENIYDISVIFPDADLRFARLSGVIPFYKRTDSVVAANLERVHLVNVAQKWNRPFGDAYITVLISYDEKTTRLAFDDIFAEWKGKIRLFGSGYVTFDKPPLRPTIKFEGRADYIDADSLINIIKIWLDPDLEKSILTRGMPSTGYVNRMNVYLDFNLRNANLRGVFADNLNFSLHYSKSQMRINRLNLALYEGSLRAKGNYFWGEQPRLNLVGNAEGIQFGTFLQKIFDVSPITGTLETNFEINAYGATERSLVDSMKINANFSSKNGELLSYTNILKPISSIGNLISLKKLDFSRSTPYKDISVNMTYQDRKFQFSNFLLKADGLSGSGGGEIGFDKKINMKFTIALPGVAGKVLKLPIIYKGTYGSNSPYIDPIWLGSVYAGTVFLAGPAGATVGGIAGSAISDYVDRAVDNVTESVQSGWFSVKGRVTKLFSSQGNEDTQKELENLKK